MKHWKRLLVAGVLLISTNQAWALPVTLTGDGSAQLFEFTGGTGPIDTPLDGYTLTTSSSVLIELTDRRAIGDIYTLYVNGATLLTTSATLSSMNGAATGAETFSQAWNNAYLSKGSLYLGPGTYKLDIKAIAVAQGYDYGSGYIRATNVPEPSTLLMLGAGILGLGLFQYRKWSKTNS